MAKQKRAAKQTDKPVKRVRVLSVEVSRIGETKDEDKAARQRLRDLCEQVQQATNYVWMTWFRWHVEHDSPTLVREFVAARAAWHKGDRQGKEPKLDLKPVPNELSNLFYHGICEQWPELHSRVVVLLLNRLNGLIAKRKSANGSLPGWQSILLYRESVPSSTRPLPLPFDTPKTAESSNGNAKLQSPLSAEDSHRWAQIRGLTGFYSFPKSRQAGGVNTGESHTDNPVRLGANAIGQFCDTTGGQAMPRQSDTTGFRCAGDGCRGMTYVIRVVHLRSNKTVRHRICRVCQLRQQSVEMPSVLKEVKPR